MDSELSAYFIVAIAAVFLSLMVIIFARRIRTGKYWTARDEQRWKTHPGYPVFFAIVTFILVAALAVHNLAH